MSTAGALGTAALAILAVMVITWVISLLVRDASIVDIVWGLGFVVTAWVTRVAVDGYQARQNVLVILTTVWGVRLSLYLARRNLGHGEDYRYQSMRRRAGSSFAVKSLVTVFLLQGAVMWIVSLPVQLGQSSDDKGAFAVFVVVGTFVWAVGMFFETVGDWQLTRFKADPSNAGTVMDRGLWSWTRHPNYFGDFCVWWGIFIVAASAWPGPISVIGPVVMTVMLTRVSGKALLERGLKKRREGYDAYIARTSGFFPRPPRSA